MVETSGRCKLPHELNVKIYAPVIRPVIVCETDTWTLKIKQEVFLVCSKKRLNRWTNIPLTEDKTNEAVRHLQELRTWKTS